MGPEYAQEPVLQRTLPHPPWLDPAVWRLPGVQPLDPADWLIADDAFAGQMRLRDNLIGALQKDIYALQPDAEPAAWECLEMVLDALSAMPGYDVREKHVIRPDSVKVTIHRQTPLLTIGRLIQADVCLLERRGREHVLTGAILCFPAGWTLAEKIGRPLLRIHQPVEAYDAAMANRVQRIFDGLTPGQVVWRANALLYDDPRLFAPRREEGPSQRPTLETARFVRSERQTLRRMANTGAVVFTIHTYIVPVEDLSEDARRGLSELLR